MTRTINTRPPLLPERLFGGKAILRPNPGNSWESRVVLNPAAVLVELGSIFDSLTRNVPGRNRLVMAEGLCAMIYRAQGAIDRHKGMAPSSLGLALFTPNLLPVYRCPIPVLTPDAPFHNLGLEDPRCTKVGDTYYLYYTGYACTCPSNPEAERTVKICLATSKNLLVWILRGPVGGDVNDVPNKNAALLPEVVRGKWILLHRPMAGPDSMKIHLAEAARPEGPWCTRGSLMPAFRYKEFERSWIGAAGPPLALGDDQFLMIYHQGHLTSTGHREYDLALALLDFSQDEIVRSRIEPWMRPSGFGGCEGDPDLGVDNVLFSCANYVWRDNLVLPYAGADSVILGVTISMKAMVKELKRHA